MFLSIRISHAHALFMLLGFFFGFFFALVSHRATDSEVLMKAKALHGRLNGSPGKLDTFYRRL